MILRAVKAAFLTLELLFTKYSQKILKQAEMYLKTSFALTPYEVEKLTIT